MDAEKLDYIVISNTRRALSESDVKALVEALIALNERVRMLESAVEILRYRIQRLEEKLL